MNVVLIGYRATGKSTVATDLGRRLTWPIVSLDQRIVERAGMPITDLVAARGWSHFRDLEELVVGEACTLSNHVIDCGGGVVEREANFEPLRRSGTVVWLRADPDTIARRLAHVSDRPALTQGRSPVDEIREVLARRNPLYARLAHVALDVTDSAPAEISDRILSLLPRP